ncbi:serine hydrolase [Lewinella sp. W8]|uniref:serine hydrolase domain-containing protein n=1 Tax=Lewinella sp. W8 TaxID=2528208 RepID=UPI001067EE54|nr:serine hydrolase [Lewinella sp. W8]MTB52059.1 serine hydrolase [Lewinella sp. W8]
MMIRLPQIFPLLFSLTLLGTGPAVAQSSATGQLTFHDQQSGGTPRKRMVFREGDPLYANLKLAAPIAASLAELAPDTPKDSLFLRGNFHFTFRVDGEVVYEEALNAGAGSRTFKEQATDFRMPLSSKLGEDFWSRFMWMRFYYRGGGLLALAEGQHELTLEVRPYRYADGKTGQLLARGSVLLDCVRPAVDERQLALSPPNYDEAFGPGRIPIDTTLVQNLKRRIHQGVFKDITGIAVVRDGQLLLEEYFNGAAASTLHDTRSVGKTFAGAALGIAIADGHIAGEDLTLGEVYDLRKFDNYHPAKEDISLRDLLTMSVPLQGSDNDFSSPGNEEYMYPTDDWVKFALDLPVDATKLERPRWDYFTAGVVVLGDVIHRSVPKGLEAYAEAKLFAPLGIKDYRWQYTPQRVANTAGGLQLNLLGLARFGQLYLNGGSWKGESIIPAEWVDKSLAEQVALPRDTPGGGYGYLFWRQHYRVGEKIYPTAHCSGNGGNKVYVFPEQHTVIIVTARAYGRPYGHPQVDQLMENYLLPAVMKGH